MLVFEGSKKLLVKVGRILACARLGNTVFAGPRHSTSSFLHQHHRAFILTAMNTGRLISSNVTRAVFRYVCPQCRSCSSISQRTRWRPLTAKNEELGGKTWQRGAKKQTILTVKAKAQGSLPVKPVEIVDENDGPSYPTVVQQARNNMQKFSHCVVLTRVGNFYEVISS